MTAWGYRSIVPVLVVLGTALVIVFFGWATHRLDEEPKS